MEGRAAKNTKRELLFFHHASFHYAMTSSILEDENFQSSGCSGARDARALMPQCAQDLRVIYTNRKNGTPRFREVLTGTVAAITCANLTRSYDIP